MCRRLGSPTLRDAGHGGREKYRKGSYVLSCLVYLYNLVYINMHCMYVYIMYMYIYMYNDRTMNMICMSTANPS